MKNVQKIISILLVALLISFTPLAEYTNIEQIETVKADALAIGAGTVLALALLAAGVYIAPDAEESAVADFSNWLSLEGRQSSLEFLHSCDTNKYATLPTAFMVDVVDWAGSHISDLLSGVVSSASFGGVNTKIPSDSLYALALETALDTSGITAAFCYESTKYLGLAYAFNTSYPIYVVQQSYSTGTVKSSFYYLDSSNKLRQQRVTNHFYVTTGLVSGSSSTGSSGAINIPAMADSIGYDGNITFVNIAYDGALSSSFDLDVLLSMADSVVGPSTKVEKALTSFGDYVQDNIGKLAGLTFSASMAKALVNGVTDTIDANKVVDSAGAVTYADDIAELVSSAYAAGLAEAIAQQGTVEDEMEKEEGSAVTNGILLDIFDSVTLTKDLITTFPADFAETFSEVFPTAQEVKELIHDIPANIVSALPDVFPTKQELQELIWDLPSDIVSATQAMGKEVSDAVDIGSQAVLGALGSLADTYDLGAQAMLGSLEALSAKIASVADVNAATKTVADAIAEVKEATLAIPNSIAGAITDSLADLFVPDLTVVEGELEKINSSLGWIEPLHFAMKEHLYELEAGDPPTVYLDFTKATDSKYHPAGKVLAIRFDWYAPYKPTGDMIVGAFMWLLYFWWLFKRIPDIIGGSGFIIRQNYDSYTAYKRDSSVDKAGVERRGRGA